MQSLWCIKFGCIAVPDKNDGIFLVAVQRNLFGHSLLFICLGTIMKLFCIHTGDRSHIKSPNYLQFSIFICHLYILWNHIVKHPKFPYPILSHPWNSCLICRSVTWTTPNNTTLLPRLESVQDLNQLNLSENDFLIKMLE